MFDVNDDAKVGFRRIEVLTGPERRRRWSAEEKARIVAGDPGAWGSGVRGRAALAAMFAAGLWLASARRGTAMAEKPADAGAPLCADLTRSTPAAAVQRARRRRRR